MKRTKKWLLSALAMACTVTSVFAVTSCKGDHEHVYTDVVTAPTCTEEGFTTHTCECGDSYVDTKVEALGHSYSTQFKYPTLTEAGEKATVCANCGDKTTEVIPAWSTKSPKLVDVVLNAISTENIQFAVDANSTLSIEGVENLDQYIYTALAESMGVEVDTAKTVVYIGGELVAYVPKLANLLYSERPVITESYINEVKALLALVGEDIIVETTEGANSVYTVDLSALNHFVDDVKDETVGSYIDRLYGAGSMDAIVNFVTTLPDKTVKDIANSAIALANTYGMDVYYVYHLVNMVASEAGAQDFDIQALIEEQYDKTIGGLIIEAIGDETMTVESLKAMIAPYATMIPDLTIDSIYTMVSGEEDSITEQISAMIEALPGMASASLTFDANGAFVSANAFVGEQNVAISVANGLNFSFAIDGAEFALNIDEDSCEADLKVEGEEDKYDLLDLAATLDNRAITAAEIVVRGVEGGYYESHWNEETETHEDVYVPEELVVQAEIDYTATVANGVVTSAHAEIFAWDGEYQYIYDEYDNYIGSEWVEEWKEVADITYTNNEGNISIIGLFEDEAKIEITNEKTDSSNVFSMEIWDLQAGENDDETELIGTATFGYEGDTYFAEVIAIDDGVQETVLDAEAVFVNGELNSLDYAMKTNSDSGYGHYTDSYEIDGVLYYDYESVGSDEYLTVTFDKTENGGVWNYEIETVKTTTTWTEYWDDNANDTVIINEHANAISDVVEYTISYTATEDGVVLETVVANNGEEEVAVEVALTENGISVSAEGVSVALEAIDNGVQCTVEAEGVDITLDVTAVDNVLHIGYDFGETEMITGKGGISITVS